MEVFIKILYFLCLSSATISLQLLPSLNIKTPIGLDLGIGEINTNLLNNIDTQNSKLIPSQQCFCIPNSPNSQSVINYLEPTNGDLERKVIFLYKSNGVLKIYIPNKNKQDLIPELNFDYNEGDILKPVSSESINELFDPNINMPQEISAEEIMKEPDTIDAETDKPHSINTGSDELSGENTDYSPPTSSEDNNSAPQEDSSFDEQNAPINNLLQPSSPTKPEEIDNPELNVNTNLNDADTSSSKPQPINNEVPTIQDQNLDITENNLDNISTLKGYNQLQQIFTILPLKPQSYPEPTLQQNPYHTNSGINSYNTFNQWFNVQLKRVVLYNLETPTKIIELRERIKKVLQDNGMRLTIKGIVTDLNGNLVQLNNIKLRPILIGQNDPQNVLDQQTTYPEPGVSYVQIIEVILVAPPKLLGTLVLGTVYLPRNIHGGQNVNLWNNRHSVNIKHLLSCPTCKRIHPQNIYRQPQPLTNHLQNRPIPILYGQLHGLPFRRNFKTGKQISIDGLPHVGHRVVSAAPETPVSEDVNRSALGDVFKELLGNLGISQSTRRVIGGVLPNGLKPGPQSDPKDVLPGLRIIGGNAATSSGTPLVNKGRSGFQPSSLIV